MAMFDLDFARAVRDRSVYRGHKPFRAEGPTLGVSAKRGVLSIKKLLIATFLLHGIAHAQQISNKDFALGVSASGVNSLKRTRDVYDTNYILAGRTLGDVLVRYRLSGEAWKEVSSA